MRRPKIFILATSTLVLLAGCSSNSLVGTWQGRGDTAERPFTFGSVTFAPDGTYTAEAKYGDTTRVQTGRYTEQPGTVTLDDVERTYDLDFEQDAVIFTDPGTGKSMTLDRFK
ncbi:MAG: hypothetical protein MK085_08750 [Phycisphaerales bacterium]|nr:hypothetical protein [Phycisphaerales bacterium]